MEGKFGMYIHMYVEKDHVAGGEKKSEIHVK